MAGTTPCVPCCRETQTVNVPGVEGPAGTPCVPCVDGTNGLNAYTTTTLDFVVPAVGSNVTVTVASSAWMVPGQVVICDGPANFLVVSKPTTGTAILEFLGYSGDVSPGAVVTAGATIAPSGLAGFFANQTVYGSGAVYTLTATQALLALGTTTPSLTISATGTYLLFGRARYDFAAWQSTSKTITTKLRRTNNTPADLPSATTSQALVDSAAAAITYTAGYANLPPVVYSATAGDIIQLWGALSAVASVSGTVTAVEASIVALRIA